MKKLNPKIVKLNISYFFLFFIAFITDSFLTLITGFIYLLIMKKCFGDLVNQWFTRRMTEIQAEDNPEFKENLIRLGYYDEK